MMNVAMSLHLHLLSGSATGVLALTVLRRELRARRDGRWRGERGRRGGRGRTVHRSGR